MDAKALASTKSRLRRSQSVDRSAPLIDDAAHPGSAGVLRAISVGHFELKRVDSQRDASSPRLEAGTGTSENVRPAVLAEVQSARRDSLKPTKTNDRSEPVIEKWVHIDTATKPAPYRVIDEIKEKRDSIRALSTYNEHHAVSELEKHTRPELVAELKSYKSFIEEKSEWHAKTSKTELAKNVHTNVVEEIRQKRQSIEDFTTYAAKQQSEEVYRAQTRPSLVNEILMKRPSIDALTAMHNQKSARAVGVN